MTSKQLAAVPIKSKRLEELESAVTEVLGTSVISRIRTIISDRETSVLSKKFRDSLRERYGAEVTFLSARNKSYLAESYIGKVKKSLSMGVEASRVAGDADFRCWTKLLPGVLLTFNRKFVSGTRFRRNAVDESNFEELLSQKHGVRDASLVWNSRSISGGSLRDKKWKKKLWKYAVGQRVLAKKKALGATDQFEKPSVRGGYSSKVYTVHSQSLASCGPLSLVPGEAL